MKKFYLFMLMAVGLLISGNAWANGDKNDAPQDAVCQIGDQYYSTFAKAIADVPTTGVETVVELLKDCEAGGIGKEVSIAAGKNVTLNCNLFTIRNARTDSNGPSGANTTPVLKVYGTLTLNGTANPDSSVVGGIDGLNFCVMTVESADAKITINGGRYQSHDKMAIIEINKSAELVINGGDFKGGNNGRYGMVVYNSSNDPKITINGGRFDANIEKCSNSQGAALIATRGSNPKVEINDGLFTIKYSGSKVTSVNACIDIRSSNAEVSINGGTFINSTEKDRTESPGSSQNAVALFLYEAVKKANITNGYFYSPNGMGGQIYSSSGSVNTINIEDVTFIGGYCGLMITNYGVNNHITLNGGYYKSTGTMGIYVGSKSNVDFMWGKVENTGAGYGIYQDDATSTLNITGGTITVASEKNAIYHKEGKLTVSGTTKLEGCLYIKGGNTTISGGSIIADKQGAVWNYGGTITISGTPVITSTHSDGFAFYNQGGTATIDGGQFKSVHSVYGSAGTTTLSDGIYSVQPILNSYCAVKPDYEVVTNPDPSTIDVYPYAIGKMHFEEQTVSGEDDRTIDWQTETTWTGDDVIPDKGDDVTIADGKNVEVGQSGQTEAYAHQITVDNGSDLIIDGGSQLTVGNGGLIVGSTGDIIIKSTAGEGTGVLLFSPVAEETVTTVEATIELHTTAHKDEDGNYHWNYIGIPLRVENFTAANWEKIPVVAGQETGSYLQIWDFTEGWVNKGLEVLQPFQGVAITNESKDGVIYRFKGTMVGNADKDMQFKPRGYNFFANSYTAPIDIETLLNELKDNGVVDAAVYMFDTESNRFQGVALSAFEGFIPPYFRVIPSMNGFFILNQKSQAAQQLMDYGNAVYNCALGNRPIFAPKHEAMNFSRVHINVETEGSKDGLYLIENEEFTSEFENGYDVIKYMTEGQSNIYAQTTTGRQSELFNSNIEGTMIGFEAAADQTMYTLSFDELQGDTFVLTDMETGETIVMSEDVTYTFFAQAGQHNDNRFMVTRANKAPTATDVVKGNAKAQGIYSITGHYFGNVTEWNRLPQGVYLVNGVKVIK